jgi:hypothetical protein
VKKVRMTEAQAAAFEIYVADPVHCEAGAEIMDDPDYPTCAAYREAAAMRKKDSLHVPPGKVDMVESILTEACNSADAERTAEGNRAARSLCSLSSRLRKVK